MTIPDALKYTIVNSLLKFNSWRIKHINNKNFIILVSILIGIVGGLAAALLKEMVHYVEAFVESFSDVEYHNYLYFFFPATGILITVFYVQYFLKGKLGRGISSVLYSVARKKGEIPGDKTYTHIITSALTVGFGGSAGLEAPIVVTGSAIGSNIASIFHLNSRERILLLACGTAAGVSAIFNSPIGAVIFAMEVLLVELTVPAFIPLLIASATATVVSKLLHSRQLFHLITGGWELRAIPFYIILGVFCGLLSVYVSKVTLKTEGWIQTQKGTYNKALYGGLALGFMIFIFPPLYGEGYATIENLFRGNYHKLLDNSLFYQLNHIPLFILFYTAVLILIKVVATSVTIASGGNGGIFATTMMTGALGGFFLSYGINHITHFQLNETNFIAVGMAGLLSGVIHAPLTAIFLIAEITGGYVLFVPLMIVSAISFFIARYVEPHTVYTKKLAEKGELADRDKDKMVLGLMNLNTLIERDFSVLYENQCLGDIVKAIIASRRSIFPVLKTNGELAGIIRFALIKEVIFQQDQYDCLMVKDIMETDYPVVNLNEEMYSVMKKFDESDLYNLPVTEAGIYKGFISKSSIFPYYRSLIIEEGKALTSL